MPEHKVGTREQWLAARKELLEREKELTRRSDELARQRQELPWVPVEKEYAFDTNEGTKTLADLFDGRSQLIVYHFMHGPNTPEGCPAARSTRDHFDGAVVHLNHRDVTFLCASRSPLETLRSTRTSGEWGGASHGCRREEPTSSSTSACSPRSSAAPAPATTSARPVTPISAPDDEELMGAERFALEDGVVYHTYSCYDRGTDVLNPPGSCSTAPAARVVAAKACRAAMAVRRSMPSTTT